MKVAVISPIAVVPAYEGNSCRILNLCRALRSLGHEVVFVYPQAYRSGDVDDAGHVAEFGPDHFVKVTGTPLERLLYVAKRFALRARRKIRRKLGMKTGFYFSLEEFYGVGFNGKYRKLQREHGFDAVICEYIFHSAAFEAFPGSVHKILDTHDTFADRHKLFGNDDYWFSVPVDEQVRGFKRADVVVAIQDEEAETFKAQIGGEVPEVAVVSHFLDLSHRISDYGSADAVFLGSSYIANVRSLSYFIDRVLPLIVREMPGFRLVVAGSICKVICDHPNVEKIGFVDHVSDAYRKAQISVNPTLMGTGINIKLLDAMAAGVVTVATETGLRGLSARYRAGVVEVADNDPEAFARHVIELARSESRRADLGGSAYAAAEAWNADQMSSLARVLVPSGKRTPIAAE